MFKSLGGYTYALKDYYNVNLTLYLDNPFLKGVVETFDPYSIFPNLFYVSIYFMYLCISLFSRYKGLPTSLTGGHSTWVYLYYAMPMYLWLRKFGRPSKMRIKGSENNKKVPTQRKSLFEQTFLPKGLYFYLNRLFLCFLSTWLFATTFWLHHPFCGW
jgi:hypothetical protein